MARASTQHKLDRVRPPRVHITYDVEIGDAIEMKELPFVMGVLGDYTGQPTEPLPQLRERKFTEVNPDNFDAVLAGMKPHLAFSVEEQTDQRTLRVPISIDFTSAAWTTLSRTPWRARCRRSRNCSICAPSYRTCADRCRATMAPRRPRPPSKLSRLRAEARKEREKKKQPKIDTQQKRAEPLKK